jgi:hypothetical protein
MLEELHVHSKLMVDDMIYTHSTTNCTFVKVLRVQLGQSLNTDHRNWTFGETAKSHLDSHVEGTGQERIGLLV